MAGSEIYRVEIPIIVDDQSEAPLSRARKRVNKFEQAAQKTNRRIRQMSLTDYRLRLSVLDRTRPALEKVGRTLKRLTARAWTFTVAVKDKVTGFFGRVGGFFRRVGGFLMSPLGLLGLGGGVYGAVGLFKQVVGVAVQFEQSLANVQSVAGATKEELVLLREAALSAGKETVFSASEAADALYYLASAGFNVEQQIGALRGTLALAAATQSDLAFTSETMAATISAFGLKAEEADRVANVFAATISNSQATMNKLADSMRYAGPAAAGFGRSLEETAAALALFYNMGLTGEMAGTRLRSALSALAHPTGETKKALQALGISTKQVDPSLNNLADIIDLLKAKGVDTTMAMRLFGQETGPAMAGLIEQGGNALREMERRLTGTSKALEMAEMQTDTLMGAQKMLRSVWESVSITLGTQSIPGLRRLVEWLQEAVGGAEDLAEKIGSRLNEAFEWLADILESPEFEKADWVGKVRILIEETAAWLEGPGGEMVKEAATTVGELIGEGLEAAAPTIVEAATRLGYQAAKGFFDGITSSPYGALLLAYLGFRVGGKWGALVGGAVGAGAYIYKEIKKEGFHSLSEPMTASLKSKKAKTETWQWYGSVPKRAAGGIYSKPHVALVAEAGPEAIIPLSEKMRNRALDLWTETGSRLGVRAYAAGGFAGAVPVAVPATAGAGISITNNISVSVKSTGDADPDRIADAIAVKVERVFHNMPNTLK